ncbi:nidogen-2 [Pseudophryne corroboree]|uniref:nidogen-2 n=1 Tax=Pseudophryne corroboree TaxID=495146 RepID=UPI0030817CFD
MGSEEQQQQQHQADVPRSLCRPLSPPWEAAGPAHPAGSRLGVGSCGRSRVSIAECGAQYPPCLRLPVTMRDRALHLLLHLHCLLACTAALSRLDLFPYGERSGDRLLPDGDDETSELVRLAQPLLFYEAELTGLYVGTNGIISPQYFPRETQYVDDGFPTDFPAIAPFLSDIDTSNGRGKIYYRQDSSPEILSAAARQIQRGFPQAAFSPTNVFLVTWDNVGAYEEVTRHADPSNRVNTFQAVLAYDESDSYAIFLYPEHGLQFLGTRPKESYNVHIDLPARVGFSRGESESLKREAPYYSVVSGEQSLKNLYQKSNIGTPGVWVFHIGSITEIDNIIPAKVLSPHAQERYVPLINSHNDFPEHQELENHGTNNYEDNYDDEEEVDYPTNPTTELPTTDVARVNVDGSRSYLDIDDHTTSDSDLEGEQESLPHNPSNNPLPPTWDQPSWTLYGRDGIVNEPEIRPSVSRNLGNEPSYETREEPSEAVNEDFSNVTPNPEDRQNPDVYRSRNYGYDDHGGFDTDVLTFNPVNRETCERKPGHCSQNAFCTDYSTGFCCHCQDNFYGNGIHCLPKGAPHRVNGKVSGSLLVGQTPVRFDGIDLHAYIVVNDGRAYTAISQVPEPASWSLTPLTAIGGLFGWLFALEKPGHQNGFSVTGAKFIHNIEAIFSPGDEAIHITQTADGFDSDNYIHLRTTIKGKIPYIPETSTIQISPYYEIYQYSGSVVTSTTNREYTVTSEDNVVQRFSYRLKQNITFQDCSHGQRFPPNAQKLSVDRVFALYNKDEKVLRFAITSHIGSLHDSSQEQIQVNPCFDGTHMCDTRAQCQPGAGLNYTCVCASGYQGDGTDCTDVDECDVRLANCGQNTQCLNLPGSYRCECLPGHTFSADGQSCILAGSYGNPCEDGTHTCNSATSQCVPRGDGVFTCECFPGYVRSGQSCIDVDECTERRCHPDAECTNVPGSFACQCRHGYTGDGFQCTQAPDYRPRPTSCLEKRRALLGDAPPRGPRPFVPECDSEGNYVPLQCYGSTGYCWCVNKDGEEIEGTKTAPGQGPPQCGAPDDQSPSTSCLEKRQALLGGSQPRGARPIGGFIPECDEEGNYIPRQCHGGTGHCWCVDQNGVEIAGTRRPHGSGTPQCSIPEPTQRPQTMCERWKQSLLDHYGGTPSAEHYIPQCDAYGDFTPLQCHGNSGYCWCVDKDGRELEGSRTQPGMTPACLPSVAPPTVRPTPRPDVTPPASGTYLLYAQGQQIGYLPLDGTKLRKDKARTLLSLHGSIVVGIDYDCQEKKLYWTDVAGRTISRAGLEPGAEPEVIISTDLISPEGLAIDFLRRTMFWTDSGTDKIESSRLDGSDRKTLFDTNLVNPRAITIDAVRGNLYWTDWNREAPKIETSFVDGSNRRILVNDNIGLPNGLTFDPFSKQICWADAGTKKLECILSSGSGRRVVQSNLNYPFSVVAYANHFYHTDWRRDGVIAVNKESGEIAEEYLPEQRSHLYGITAVYPYCPSGRK